MPRRHETLTSLFNDIADAIRAKTGDSADIVADNFDEAIEAIPSGGGSDNYFYIECVEDGSVRFSTAIGTVDVALQYSSNKTDWTDYTLNTTIDMTTGQKIYWKNNKNHLNLYGNYIRIYHSTDFKYNVGGRINSLINNIDGKGCYPYAFNNLFGSTALIDASELILPIFLSEHCYSSMFQSCTSLTTAPQLSATTLASYCYSNMFQGCASLTTAPELPATTLIDNCYYYMFQGCTSLTTILELPATTLAANCYSNMFYGCTSLTTAPQLPATTLANYCYANMFQSCTSLTTAPQLSATSLANYCYQYMFGGCTSLTTAPQLPATTLFNYCYSSMFSGCTSLTTAPELPATTLSPGCYANMFSGCTSLNVYSTSGTGHDKAWNIPSTGPITGTTRSMTSMFSGVNHDQNVPTTWPGVAGQQYTYYTQNTPV